VDLKGCRIPDKGKMAEHFFMDKMAVPIGEPCVLGCETIQYEGLFSGTAPISGQFLQKRNCISLVEGHGNEANF